MSRLEEVEARLAHTVDSGWPSSDAAAEYRHLSRTLAAEVDARDATITALLEMLRPKGEPMKYMLGDQKVDHDPAARVYARALEIAGRAE